MNKDDQDEVFTCCRFIARRILDAGLLTSWCITAWLVHEYVFKQFPVSGIQEMLLHAAELLLDGYSLYQIIKFLFLRPRRRASVPWWR
jgi:hypothetical protein